MIRPSNLTSGVARRGRVNYKAENQIEHGAGGHQIFVPMPPLPVVTPKPVAPVIIRSAQWLRPELLATYEHIEDIEPQRLQAMETVMIYVDPKGNLTTLNGPGAGEQGVQLYQTISGEQHYPFEQVVTESAYQLGATIERTNILKRLINFRIYIGRPGMNNFTYRACEDRWWSGQDEQNCGWFGVFTRYSGWRFIRVWPYKTVATGQKQDPVAYNNNQAIWDVDWIAPVPYYSKPATSSKPWVARLSGAPVLEADGNRYYHGTIAVPNKGDLESHVEYMITGGGTCIVQDNSSDRYVTLPLIDDTDGLVLCDTDSTHRTLIAAHDPHDDIFTKILRSVGLLNFFLTGSNNVGEPLWLRGYVRFMYSLPPQSITHLRVKHTNPNATIVAVVTQRYKRSR